MYLSALRKIGPNSTDLYPIPIYLNRLKNRVRHIMRLTDMTVYRLSTLSGVDKNALIRLTDPDDTSQPSIRTVVNVCKAMGIDIHTLMSFDGFATNCQFGNRYRSEVPFFFQELHNVIDSGERCTVKYKDALMNRADDHTIDISVYTLKVGNRIYEKLHEYDDGYSSDVLADAIYISKSTMDNYLRGIVLPSVSNLLNIAHALNCNLGDLVSTDKFIVPRKRKVVDYYSVSRGLMSVDEATSYVEPGEWIEMPEGEEVTDD